MKSNCMHTFAYTCAIIAHCVSSAVSSSVDFRSYLRQGRADMADCNFWLLQHVGQDNISN
jgi:hypothetical protein